MVTANPASGPAIPTSNSASRCGKGERMRMNAPKVPKGNWGPGRKSGGVASIRYQRQAR